MVMIRVDQLGLIPVAVEDERWLKGTNKIARAIKERGPIAGIANLITIESCGDYVMERKDVRIADSLECFMIKYRIGRIGEKTVHGGRRSSA